MTVIAHAEHGDVKRARHTGKRFPGRRCTQVRRGRRVLQACEARSRGGIAQQIVTHQLLVAARVRGLHPALVGECDADAAPVERPGVQTPGITVIGELPPETTRLASPRCAIAWERPAAIVVREPRGQRRGIGVTFHFGEGDRHESESMAGMGMG